MEHDISLRESYPSTIALQTRITIYLYGADDVLEAAERLRVDIETASIPPDFDLSHPHVLEGVRCQPLDSVATEVQLVVRLVLCLKERDLAQTHVYAVNLVPPETVAVVRRTAVRE